VGKKEIGRTLTSDGRSFLRLGGSAAALLAAQAGAGKSPRAIAAILPNLLRLSLFRRVIAAAPDKLCQFSAWALRLLSSASTINQSQCPLWNGH
jgi:hypothetical protein